MLNALPFYWYTITNWCVFFAVTLTVKYQNVSEDASILLTATLEMNLLSITFLLFIMSSIGSPQCPNALRPGPSCRTIEECPNLEPYCRNDEQWCINGTCCSKCTKHWRLPWWTLKKHISVNSVSGLKMAKSFEIFKFFLW